MSDNQFCFTEKNRKRIKAAYAKYPENRPQSALMDIMWIAQEQNNGWLSVPVMKVIAEELDIPIIKIIEIATFYSMYNTQPVGKFHIKCCQTLPCKLRGGDRILETVQRKLGMSQNETTEDGLFTLSVVECLGGCVNGPVVQVNEENYEDLTPELMSDLLDNMKQRKPTVPGSQIGRNGSEPWKGSNRKKESRNKC